MPIRVECPNCQRSIDAPDRMAGKSGRCPACESAVSVPPPVAPPRTAAPPLTLEVDGEDFDPLDVLGVGGPPPPLPPSPRVAAAPQQPQAGAPQIETERPRRFRRGDRMSVCTSCGSLTKGRTITPGSFLIELLLWMFIILPGFLYSLWRHSARHRACDVCGSRQLVPAATPRGQEILKQQGR